jgi:predicted MPP superfamily phosphohydrolase
MISFALFLAVFLSLYFLLNYYIFWRLSTLFALKRGVIFYTLLAVFTISFLAASILESHFATAFTRVLYILASLWMGLGLLLLSCLLVYEIINVFVQLPKPFAAWAVLAITAAASIYAMINAGIVRLTCLDIEAPVDMNLVQLSDIHLGSVGGDFLQQLVQKTNRLNPDAVLITGDLIDHHGKLIPQTLAPLNQLNAHAFFVTGNHERYVGVEKVVDLLKTTKTIPLRNEVVDFNGIQIIGINDSSGKNHLAGELQRLKMNTTAFKILMYHRPQGLEVASNFGINLMLSGHTHNGQIFPFNFVIRLLYKRTKGYFQYENCHLYVSSGTGTWGPQMRLGSKSEIVLIKLRKAN